MNKTLIIALLSKNYNDKFSSNIEEKACEYYNQKQYHLNLSSINLLNELTQPTLKHELKDDNTTTNDFVQLYQLSEIQYTGTPKILTLQSEPLTTTIPIIAVVIRTLNSERTQVESVHIQFIRNNS